MLTPSEWAVVDLVRHGLTNRRIAEARGTSVDATKQHVASAIAKLDLADRASLRHWSGIPADSARLKGGPKEESWQPLTPRPGSVRWARSRSR